MSANLETLIHDSTITMPEQMKEISKWAHSEEDLASSYVLIPLLYKK